MTFLGWLSDPFKGLSDLQLGDEKALNHLVPKNDGFTPHRPYDFNTPIKKKKKREETVSRWFSRDLFMYNNTLFGGHLAIENVT